MSDFISSNQRVLDEMFTKETSFWPRSLSVDLLSLPSGGFKRALVRLPPTNMLELFRQGTACWQITEVDNRGDDPASVVLNNQGMISYLEVTGQLTTPSFNSSK
jgi:hypothetical protein